MMRSDADSGERPPITQDEKIAKAVANIRRRAERQDDVQKLLASFVDVGILHQLNNSNNQIIFGRRGTGKTHILKVFSANQSNPTTVVVYVDMRTLGSTNQFSDPTVPVTRRCTALFRDLLTVIHEAFFDHVVETAPSASQVLTDLLDIFLRVSLNPVTRVQLTAVTERDSSKKSAIGGIDAQLEYPLKGSVRLQDSETDEVIHETTRTGQASSDDKVIFRDVAWITNELLSLSKCRLLILLDEWSSLPTDLQPYLADFIKRSFFANPLVTAKIACLEQRSVFNERLGSTIRGLELGCDIDASLDIDDYYVYERDPDSVVAICADILFKHLKSELQFGYLESARGIATSGDFARAFFTEVPTFRELVRASEGIARDLINLFSTSYFSAARRGLPKIAESDVLTSARKWYDQDKAPNLDEVLSGVLTALINQVVGKKGLRAFVVPVELEKHPMLQRLFDARVIHLLRRGYEDETNPGIRYTVFSLDYGTYLHLKGGGQEPQLGFRPKLWDSSSDRPPKGGEIEARQLRKFLISRDLLEKKDRQG